MCQKVGLWQDIHALANLHVYPTIEDDFDLQVLLFDKVGREVSDLEAYVIVLLYWGIEVEIFGVNCHVVHSFGGDCTAEMQLDGAQVDGGVLQLPE